MKKLLLLAMMAIVAAGPVEAQGFFKKMGQSMKESWNKAKESNPWPGTSSSSSSSSYSSSSSSTRQSKTNVKFGSVNTSESAGRWIFVVDYSNNNQLQFIKDERGNRLFYNDSKENSPQTVFCSALRYPKSIKLPSNFTENRSPLSYRYYDAYWTNGTNEKIYYQKWGDERVKEDNVFYTNDQINEPPSQNVIFRHKEDGDWIVWEFVEDLTVFSPGSGDEWDNFNKQAQVFVSNSQQKVMEQNTQKVNEKKQKITERERKDKEVKTSDYVNILDIPNYPVKERRVINADVKDQEPHVEVLFENGDSLYIYRQPGYPGYTFGGIVWSGRIHLLNGDLIEAYPNDMKMRITYTNGKKYYGDVKGAIIAIDGSYFKGMTTVEALEKALKINDQTGKQNGFTPEGGEWTLADSKTKHEESRNERIIRENEAEAKKKAEQKQQEKQALYTKYGQKYVDALLNNGEVLVGCPFALLKERCNVKLYRTDGQDQLYHLYTWKQDPYSNVIGQKTYVWTHSLWVHNGRVTSITNHNN